MNDESRFEHRLRALIEIYAERAPIDVDPLAMTRFARVGSRRVRGFSFAARDRTLAVAMIVLALLAAIVVGAVAGGSWFAPREPLDRLTRGAVVEPFIGLPPIGATPTDPDVTELADHFAWVTHDGRGYVGSAFVYVDGRLIWNHVQVEGWREQRLTEDGIQMIQALGIRTAEADFTGRLERVEVQRLPDRAWADETVRPYVPNRFAACVFASVLDEFWGDGVSDPPYELPKLTVEERLAMLPAPASDLLHDGNRFESHVYAGPGHPFETACFGLSVADARELDAAFRDAGLERDLDRNRGLLEYHVDLGRHGPDTWWLSVWFEPVLPDGTFTCSTCG
jgi:hypothetical protein